MNKFSKPKASFFNILKNLISCFVSIVLCFLVFETLVRINPLWFIRNNDILNQCNTSIRLKSVQIKYPFLFEYFKYFENAGLYYHLKPGITIKQDDIQKFPVEIDEIGFRNKRNTFTNHEHIPYIFLGDSGTIGMAAKKNFTTIFSELMDEVVLNLGMPGYTTPHYLNSLQQYGIVKKPQIIFIVLFLNDHIEALNYVSLKKLKIDSRRLYQCRIIPNQDELSSYMVKHSDLYSLLSSYIHYFSNHTYAQESSNKISTKKFTKPKKDQMFSIVVGNGNKTHTFKNMKPPPPFPTTEKLNHFFIHYIGKIASLGKSIGSRVVLTYIPRPSEIYYPYLKEGRDYFFNKYTPQSSKFGWGG